MRRRLFNLATALSLIMFVATAMLWLAAPRLWSWAPSLGAGMTAAQMQARMDEFGTTLNEVQWTLRVQRGRLVLERYHYGDPSLRAGGPRGGQVPGGWGIPSGAAVFQAPVSGGRFVAGSRRWYAVPLWPLMLASAVLPGVAVRAMLRRRRERVRRQRGLCDVCGYDLRASPGQCPECGRVAIRAGSAA